MEDQVDCPHRVRVEEHVVPVPPSVGGPEHPPRRVPAEGVAGRGEPDGVGVVRVGSDPGDLACVGEPAKLPRLPSITGAPDAASDRDVPTDVRGSGAHVDHRWIGIGDFHGSDGPHVDPAVGDVLPGLTAAGRLPDPSSRGPEVEGVGLVDDAVHRGHPARRGTGPARGRRCPSGPRQGHRRREPPRGRPQPTRPVRRARRRRGIRWRWRGPGSLSVGSWWRSGSG